MKKFMYELDFKELKKNYDYGDLNMLEYLKDFIPEQSDLEKLYNKVLDYNEIFANGWTINKLFEMGQKDTYWIKRANNFIDKYKVKYEDYDEHTKFFDKYVELRNQLLDKLGIDTSIFDNDLNQIESKGIVEGEILCDLKKIDKENSFTVARVLNFCHCVELHYDSGLATVEFGTKMKPDYWESVIDGAFWFNKKMSEEEILKKLDELFIEEFGKEEFYVGGEANEICIML